MRENERETKGRQTERQKEEREKVLGKHLMAEKEGKLNVTEDHGTQEEGRMGRGGGGK